MTIHALWCHPRSMSTAIERIMRERGDLAVLHEPFMYRYYLDSGRAAFKDFTPEPGHPVTYEGILKLIRERAAQGPVFFKDMAYYVKDVLTSDPGFAGQMTHAFLIRDPAESVLSYAKRQPDFSLEEVGLEASWSLFSQLSDMGCSPVVIEAAKVRADPVAQMRRYWSHVGLSDAPHAFSWDTDVPDGWKSVAAWHQDVLQSGGIRPPDPNRDVMAELAALGGPYADYAAHHRPFYDKLRAYAA